MRLLVANLVFTVVMPGSVAVWVPWWITRRAALVASGPRPLGLLLFAIGGAIYAWCVWDFASFGRGTPAPIDPPKELVVRGLYRVIRNPMYVGVLTVLAGWIAWFPSTDLVLYAFAVATAFQLFIVLYEEPHLTRVFGEAYTRYRARVGRWLPRLRRPDRGEAPSAR